MIALKCPVCQHALSVGSSDPEGGFPCPNCGHLLPNRSASRDATPFGAAPRSDQPTPSQHGSSSEATLAGSATGSIATFPFLAPATSADELGWMAHYQVVRLLGQGGMGIVFEAVDTHLQRTVALKVMKPDIAKDELARQRFLREARATARVKSDHIVTIHQVSQHDDVPYIAMEFLTGEPLDHWLHRQDRPSLKEAVRIALDIARGLAAAHESGHIHRDIKPGNIWLETPSGRAKILDFGLARGDQDAGNLTQTGLILGTPAYMAPEQAEGSHVDARSDLFSLGCILYELTTGRQAFTGVSTMAILLAVANKNPAPPREVCADLPPAFSDLIMRMLAKNPADRPANARAIVAALEAIADDAGIGCRTANSMLSRTMVAPPQPPPATIPAQPPAAAPSRLLWIGIGLIVFIGLTAVAWLGWGMLKDRSGKDPSDAAWAARRATAPGVTDREILLGMSGPFVGSASELGRDMEEGLNIYFDLINSQGGVAGREIKLIALDDGYDPDRALANMIELREKRKVFAVIGNVGTPTAIKTVPYAMENKLLFFGPLTGAKLLRKVPSDRYVFNFRASYADETEAIVKYLLKKKRLRPNEIAVFAQNDGYGDDGFRGVARALDAYEHDPEKIVRVGYDRGQVKKVQAAVDTILAHPEIRAVVMVPTYTPAATFIQKLKDAKRNLIFTSTSFVGSLALADQLMELGPDYADGVIVTQVVPPIDSQATAVLKYKSVLKHQRPNARPDFLSLEGYLTAMVFVEGLKKAGEKLTTETLVDALESIRDLDLGVGVPLSFTPSIHQASHKVWGTQLDKAGVFHHLDLE